jgi:hypothetical protein
LAGSGYSDGGVAIASAWPEDMEQKDVADGDDDVEG